MVQQSAIRSNYSTQQILRFSKNDGSSLTEILLLTQAPVILNYLNIGFILALGIKPENVYLRFAFEFVGIILPLVICLTAESYLLFILYTFTIFLICIIFTSVECRRCWLFLQSDFIADEKVSCVTIFRAIVNVFTVICVLSADFVCFPRRFLKTDTHGYGLMDTGVGLFVIAYSLTDSPSKYRRSVLRSTYKVLPFFILGLGRYLSTTALNYHYQITEYGTQWNFFMTLSAITVFNELLLNFVKSIKAIFTSAVIFLILHESYLALGLEDWILSDAPRHDFISGNREGLFSLLGYESLYLCGMMIGYFLPKKGDSFQKYTSILPRYFMGYLLFSTLTKMAEWLFYVTRRTANIGYVFWILSITFISLSNIILCDIVLRMGMYWKAKDVDSASLIMRAVNHNGLLFFLLGNILTGFINLNVKTLFINDTLGIFIISLYTLICCAFNTLLYQRNIRLR